jgi:hypothetical protein
MQTTTPLTRFVLSTLLVATAAIGFAQGPPGQDPYNPPPGHGGVPPGQAKKQGYGNVPPGQAKKEGYGNVPPGQAKKYRDDYHFQNEDRGRFYGYYRSDADRWRGRKRPVFVTGRVVPNGYVVRPVPQSYWVGAPPPPPGYQYGYYGGYVVAYDPTTRIVADVLDLVGVSVTIR